MKKRTNNLFLYMIIIVIVIIGVTLVYHLAFKNNETKLITITVSDLEEKIKNNDTFVLVVSQTGCPHCEQYLPELDRTLKEVNLDAYVLNITNISEEEGNTLNKYIHFSGTPTTIFFSEGTEKTTLNRIVGYASKAKIKERLKSLGYID